MDVSECDVVDALEFGEGDDVESALLDVSFEAGCGIDPRGETVRHDDRATTPRSTVCANESHRVSDGVVLRAELLAGPGPAQQCRFEVGDAVDVDGPVRVGQRDRRVERRRVGQNVNPRPQKAGLESQAGRRIVVAAGHDHGSTGVSEPRERVGEQRVALGRRRR